LFFGQFHTVRVIHDDLVVSNIVIEFVAGTHNAA
jgi:tRNA A-37 threonylcarbamoyl transferase component Bud32